MPAALRAGDNAAHRGEVNEPVVWTSSDMTRTNYKHVRDVCCEIYSPIFMRIPLLP